MKNALPLLLLLLMAAPAGAHDHQWRYDRSVWEADLARGRALTQLVDCDSALLAEARRQFDQIDQQILTVYIRPYYPPVPAPPAPPRPEH